MELLSQLNELEKCYEFSADLECSPIHTELTKRMKKTLYAGWTGCDGISLPLTDIVVGLFENVEQGRLGQVSKRHVANITRRAHLTQCSVFLGMIYAKQLRQNSPEYVTSIKPSELFLVSMMIATKYLYDEGEAEELYNDEWAEAAKIGVNRVHDLEMEFLAAMDWKLVVQPLDFYEFLLAVETRIALSEGTKRGWLTYTDLSILMQHPAWRDTCAILLEYILKVISICTLVYSVCVATTVWSMLLLHQANLPAHSAANSCRLSFPMSQQSVKSTDPYLNPDITSEPGATFDLHADPRMISSVLDGTQGGRCQLRQQDHAGIEEREPLSSEVPRVSSCAYCAEQPTHEWPGDPTLCATTGRECQRCFTSSWSQRYADVTNTIRRVQTTLTVFYSAVMSAWSRRDVATSPHSTPCALRDSTFDLPPTCSWESNTAGACNCTLVQYQYRGSPGSGECGALVRSPSGAAVVVPPVVSAISELPVGFRTNAEVAITI